MSDDRLLNPEEKKDFQRCMEALPFYVNGTLDEEEQKWVEAYLAQHPNGQDLLAWHIDLQAHVQQRHEQQLASIPETIGLKHLKQKLAQERQAVPIKPKAEAKNQAKTNPLKEWWNAFTLNLASAQWLPVGFAMSFGMMCFLAVILSISISHNQHQATTKELTRSAVVVSPKDPNRSYLKVRFQPAITEEDLRFAIIHAGGQIIHGPNSSGEYVVEVGRGDAAKAQDALNKNNTIVLRATLSEEEAKQP